MRSFLATILTPAVVVMLLTAAAAQMPETLPWPFNKVEVFNWLWSWTRQTFHAFLNMRHPGPPKP